MGELIALLFLARELGHRAHLRLRGPGAYAAHMALNDFYSEIGDKADAIAEAYQGQFGELLEVPMLEGALPDGFATGAQFVPVMREHLNWLAQNRYTACSREQTAIQNLIDEAVSAYQSTLYKLEFLQ